MSGKIIIGVSGEIGAGKTSFVQCLEKLGVYPIYSDEIAHEILRLKTVEKKLAQYFGEGILKEGRVEPRRLADKAFKNSEGWKRLIEITHPWIVKKILKEITSAQNKYIAIDAPLLFESGLDEICNYIVWVKANPEVRKKRLKKLNWQEVTTRNSYLIPSGLKEKMADFIVVNNKEKRRLMENAKKIYSGIKSRQ
jgi:dephospho-CoA kinase